MGVSVAKGGEDLAAWQEQWGYVFCQPVLLERALTHPSRVQGTGEPTYQRLEFLGDRVVGLVVAAMLMEAFPQVSEGELARRHAALVCTERMADVAVRWGIPPLVRLGHGEAAAGGAGKPAILADVVEALMGAVFLDSVQGFEHAGRLIRDVWGPLLPLFDGRDAKTLLQEALQAEGEPLPVYTVVEEAGPAHQKTFKVRVETRYGSAEALGPNKQKASTLAAADMLFLMKTES